MDLSGKVIVVTGGNGLIGRQIVSRLKEDGATVINLDIKHTTITDTEVEADITSADSIQEAIKSIVSKHGKIYGWVNNAYPRTADWGNKWEDINPDSWAKNVDMHMNGYFKCCKYILEHMKENREGSVVNLASIYGVVAPDFTVYEGTEMTSAAGYAPIKAGIIHMSKYLAAYFGPHGIRVNCVSPGGIFDNQNEIFVRNYEKKTPLRRMGTPADIAAPISFLMSSGAAYMTGHNLVVDGGITIV